MTPSEAQSFIAANQTLFKSKVQETLCRHVDAINTLSSAGLYFFDYGNAFLLEAGRAGADVFACEKKKDFRYPSYVQHIMGDIFSLGFGPYRWICTSALEEDLFTCDKLTIDVLENIMKDDMSEDVKRQYKDNLKWIKDARKNKLVVGSQARILYTDMRVIFFSEWKIMLITNIFFLFFWRFATKYEMRHNYLESYLETTSY